MDKKVGVVLFLVIAFVGMFLVSGAHTGMNTFYGGSWLKFGEEYRDSYSGYFGGYGNSIVDLYYSYAEWVDFLLFTALFLILAQFVFGKRFGDKAGRGLAIIVAIILALSLSLWEARTGVYLLDWIGPYIVFLLVLAFIFLVLFLFRKMGGSMMFWISLTYVLFYLVFLRDVLGLFYQYRYYNFVYYNYFLDQLSVWLFFISLFGLVIGAIMWKKGPKKEE